MFSPIENYVQVLDSAFVAWGNPNPRSTATHPKSAHEFALAPMEIRRILPQLADPTYAMPHSALTALWNMRRSLCLFAQ